MALPRTTPRHTRHTLFHHATPSILAWCQKYAPGVPLLPPCHAPCATSLLCLGLTRSTARKPGDLHDLCTQVTDCVGVTRVTYRISSGSSRHRSIISVFLFLPHSVLLAAAFPPHPLATSPMSPPSPCASPIHHRPFYHYTTPTTPV